jgi:hypothetical protein
MKYIIKNWRWRILYNYCTWTRSIWGFMEQSTTILNEALFYFNFEILWKLWNFWNFLKTTFFQKNILKLSLGSFLWNLFQDTQNSLNFICSSEFFEFYLFIAWFSAILPLFSYDLKTIFVFWRQICYIFNQNKIGKMNICV